MKRFIFFSILILSVLVSCISPDIPAEREENTLSLSVSVADFCATGSSTRAAAMTAEEKTIHTLYIIQFDGTDNASKVIKSDSARLVGDKYEFDFQAVDKVCTFYFVANVQNYSIANGTTLATFLKKEIPFSYFVGGVPALGLPMCNYLTFNPSTQLPTLSVTLKPLVARLILTYNVDPAVLILSGGQLPECFLKGYFAGCFGERPSGQTTSWFPTNVTNHKVSLGKSNYVSHTLYVAENMAGEGRVSGGWVFRTPSTAPPGAMYVQFDCPTNSGMYYVRFYIGNQFKPNDFNIQRGYTYEVLLSLLKLNTGDPRVTQISTP